MADFTDFLFKIQELEENVSLEVQINEKLNQFDDESELLPKTDFSSIYNGAKGLFSSIHGLAQGKVNLSKYLASLSAQNKKDEMSPEQGDQTLAITPAVSNGVPSSFFAEPDLLPVPDFLNIQTEDSIDANPDTFSDSVNLIKANTLVNLPPFAYSSFTLTKSNLIFDASQGAIFESAISPDGTDVPFVLSQGSAIFRNIDFKKGSLNIQGGIFQFESCRFATSITTSEDSIVIFSKCVFSSLLEIKEKTNLYITDCEFTNSSITLLDSPSFICHNSTFSDSPQPFIISRGGQSNIDSSQFSNSHGPCIATENCEMLLTNCTLSNSTSVSLLEASNHSIVRIKVSQFNGESPVAILAINSASVSCDNLNLKKALVVFNEGYLLFNNSTLDSAGISCENGHIQITDSKITSSPHSSLIAIGKSDVTLEGSKITKCASNAIEIVDSSSLFANNSRFTNSHAGALILTSSCKFNKCKFHRNDIGAQIDGEGVSPMFSDCFFIANEITGAVVVRGSSPQFQNCNFENNEKCAISILSSYPKFFSTRFAGNHMIGVDITDDSDATFKTCLFDGNNSTGAQLRKNAKARFSECHFMNHDNSIGMLIAEHAKCSLDACQFRHNGHCGLELKDEAGAKLFNNCIFSDSVYGVGFYAHHGGHFDISNCKFTEEKKTGLFICQKSKGVVSNCEISKCGECGIIVENMGVVTVRDSEIFSNGSCGIRSEGGAAKIERCKISVHPEYGIYATPSSKISQKDNEFSNNEKADTKF